jgi:FtsP/CotA-like multicopper oxidase with cupredoxin domain
MHDSTRRQILTGSAAVALGMAARPAAAAGDPAISGSEDWIELETAIKETILDGHRVRLRAYNGQIPGPTMTVVPGQTLRVRLKNSLPPYDSSQWGGDHNVPHGLDATNLHVHGLDVVPHIFEPIGTSDPLATQIVIRPGEQKEYVFEISKDHPPGLNFYHPHKHGATAVQLVSGLAGPIIVRGAIDEVPEIKAAREIPLVVQDIGLFPSENDPELWTYEPVQNAMWQTFGGFVTIKGERTKLRGGFTTGDYRLRYFLLNGVPFFKETHNDKPGEAQEPVATQLPVQRFRLAPGEVVRFRMLNGSSDNLMPIVVDGHDVHQIAMDGVNFPSVRTIAARPAGDASGQIVLASANRSDFLVKGSSTPGIYRIRQLAQKQQFLASAEKIIAEIEVAGPAKNMRLPDKLPLPAREYPLIEASEVKRIRVIEFTGNTPALINTIVGGDYLINNAIYHEQEIPVVVNLNEAEEWHLVVGTSHHGGTEGHPFHIHVNSFEVISINGVMQPSGTIQDTVWVGVGETVVVRMRFRQWIGKSVFHCHIPPHEDVGMMQNFLIVDPTKVSHNHRS